MATRNGIELLRPMAVSELLKRHNMLRDVAKSVSDTRADTEAQESQCRNCLIPVTPIA